MVGVTTLPISEEHLVSHQRVSASHVGGPVTLSGELLGQSWKLPETFGLLPNSTVRGSRRGTSGEERGNFGKSREFPEALEKSDSLPMTLLRNCFQPIAALHMSGLEEAVHCCGW